jgi:hypothetical protein
MSEALLPCPRLFAPQVYDNIFYCRGVTPERKLIFLDAILNCGDEQYAEDALAPQRYGNLRMGPKPPDLYADEGLGVFVDEAIFKKHVAAAFDLSVEKFEEKLNAFLSYHRKRARRENPTETERFEAMSFMTTKVPARSDGSVWLFRNPERDRNAFAGLTGLDDDEWLAHRLGLDLSRWGPAGLTFSFYRARVEDIHYPTFYDVPWSLLPLWDWRGKTRPLLGTPLGLDGLEEVIAKPPQIGRHEPPVIRLTIRRP